MKTNELDPITEKDIFTMKVICFFALVCIIIPLAKADLVKRSVTCPQYWAESNGRCFQYITTELSWAQAELHCQTIGGNLASIHDIGNSAKIIQIMFWADHGNRVAWAGGTNAQENDIWLWSDGTPFEFNNWCVGEPNGVARGAHCVQINYSAQHCWDDDICTIAKPFVCVMTP
ncbi:type-2 ice-structuring protein-like [Synchiropus picturatus]